MVVRCLAVALLVSGLASSAAAEDYPVVDAPVPAFGTQAPARYVDDIPIVQDLIAAPWEVVTRSSAPRRKSDIAVPDGW